MTNYLRSFKTKESYTNALLAELSPTELALLNFAIYYNPNHSQYYEMFHCGEYESCWKYLMDHRAEMTIENVPSKWMVRARLSIESMKAMIESGAIAVITSESNDE